MQLERGDNTMLHELSRDEYEKVRPMVGDKTNLAARAVISGNNPGWIFVDNKESPQTALVWAKGVEGSYLMGKTSNRTFNAALNLFVDEVIKPRSLALGYTWFEVSGTQEEWEEVIEEIFYRRGLQQWTQRVYTHTRKLAPDSRPLVDFTMRIAPLDQRLMTSDLRNLDIVTAELERYWDSLEQFYDKGFGYAIIWRGLVADMCYVAFTDGDEFELSTKSYDPLMRESLTRATTVECLKHIINRRGEAYWDCTDTNVTAYRTAESLGFNRVWEYQCYGFPL